MAGYPRATKFTKLLQGLGKAQRRQFWNATGIGIGKHSLNVERFDSFKNAVADYREYVTKSRGLSSEVTIQARGEIVCDSCGAADQNEIYFTVPRCIRFCMRCTEELICDVENS